jgi:hypothetical protein
MVANVPGFDPLTHWPITKSIHLDSKPQVTHMPGHASMVSTSILNAWDDLLLLKSRHIYMFKPPGAVVVNKLPSIVRRHAKIELSPDHTSFM